MKLKMMIVLSLAFCVSAFGGVVGKWKVAANAPDGNVYNVDLIVKDEGGKASAVLSSERGEMPLQDVAIAGDDLTFKLVMDMGPIAFKLKAEGDNIAGAMTLPDGTGGKVTGKRDGAAPAGAAAVASGSVAGKWKVAAKMPDGGEMKVTMEFTETAGKYSGQATTENGEVAPVTDIKLEGGVFSFKVPTDEGAWAGTGKLAGNEIKGTVKAPNGTSLTFVAIKG
ncbi:MAG: hypothetical protein IPP47_31345 [Bryobacterales bacterium]|nr:hypothetical protein [Bryobacterales bacterium]